MNEQLQRGGFEAQFLSVHAIGTLGRASSGLAEDAVISLIHSCSENHYDVCNAAEEGIIALIQVSPGLAGTVMSYLG